MPQVQTLRAFVQQRLTAAAEEIFELFERTIAEYEETLQRQGKLLDPNVKTQDVQLLSASKEEVSTEQQEWSPSPDQEDPPEQLYVKEEPEELWTGQGGEQLQGLKEADISKFPPTPVPVKSEEEDEEKPQSSQLDHAEEMKPEAYVEDCGGPEPDRNLNPQSALPPDADDETSHSSVPESDHRCDWEETSEPPSGLNPLRNSELKSNTRKTHVGFSECSTSFGSMRHLQKHIGIQTGEKKFSCSICGKEYYWEKSLASHRRVHSEGKRFSCSVCQKTFLFRGDVVRHMRVHTGEKPFSCSVCGTRFTQKQHLTRHLCIHTGEKPFSCSICEKSFSQICNLKRHTQKCVGERSGSK